MSASAIVVHVAAVCSDCTIRLPIAWRMRESGWPATRSSAAGAGAAATGAAFGTSSTLLKRGSRFFAGAGSSGRYGLSMCIGASAGASRAASTSCLRTRPPRPVPCTVDRSMSCSAAMRWTTGE